MRQLPLENHQTGTKYTADAGMHAPLCLKGDNILDFCLQILFMLQSDMCLHF
jgi:hypothetical protein